MTTPDTPASIRLVMLFLLTLFCTGCSSLLSKPTPQPTFYALDSDKAPPRVAPKPGIGAPTLLINPSRAAAGYDSQRIIYVREAHKLAYFAHSEWVETPGRMLLPLIAGAIESRGAFAAVVQAPSAVVGDLRLDTEILRLQQDFTSQPSRIHFTLRAFLVDSTTRRVIAWQEFDGMQATASDDAQGGVIAANRVVQSVLGQLADFCSTATEKWLAAKTAAHPRTTSP